jgi:hypothetical protein
MGVDSELLAPFCALAIVLLLAVRIGWALSLAAFPLYLDHWIGVFAANAVLTPIGLRGSMVAHHVFVHWGWIGYCDCSLLVHRPEGVGDAR